MRFHDRHSDDVGTVTSPFLRRLGKSLDRGLFVVGVWVCRIGVLAGKVQKRWWEVSVSVSDFKTVIIKNGKQRADRRCGCGCGCEFEVAAN